MVTAFLDWLGSSNSSCCERFAVVDMAKSSRSIVSNRTKRAASPVPSRIESKKKRKIEIVPKKEEKIEAVEKKVVKKAQKRKRSTTSSSSSTSSKPKKAAPPVKPKKGKARSHVVSHGDVIP